MVHHDDNVGEFKAAPTSVPDREAGARRAWPGALFVLFPERRGDLIVAVPDGLQRLLDDGLIDAVHGRLMSGKEAEVFVVERGGVLIAAKVYKDRELRTFKATADYTEGRNQTRSSRDRRAMGKRTTYGKALIEKSWRDMEYQALHDAFSAGVRVPEPFLLYEDVLLMELLVDDAGVPAPRLADFELPAEVAVLLHREIYGQVRMLLAAGRIHGDLSAFNILIARDGPTLIDLPQVVDAAGNNQAATILRRDLQNVTEHLARFDARLLRFRTCGDALWQHYQRGTLEHATEPQEGSVQRERHGGRRHRDAERGKMGRSHHRQQPPMGREDRGPPPPRPRRDDRPQQQHRREDRPPPPQHRREDRPPPPQHRRDERPPPPRRHPADRPPPVREDRPPQHRPRGEGPPQPRRDDWPPGPRKPR